MKKFLNNFSEFVRKSRKKTIAITLIIIVILTSISALLLYWPKNINAAWFDDSYAYRKKITIGNSGAADASKKVKFDIDTAALITAGKMQSDCDDTRFTDNNGKVLQYFIDSGVGACNTNSTDYYVLVLTINSGNTDLYMYYGNPSANIGSNSVQFTESTFSPTSGPTLATEEKGTGPVAYWKLDEGTDNSCSGGTNDTCNSTGDTSNDGSLSGAIWKPEDLCVSGKCLWFDGSDDVVTITNNNSIDFDTLLAAGVSFETWFKANSDGESDTGQIFQKGTNTYCRVDTESAGAVDVECSLDLDTTDATLNISAPVKINTWHHLVMSYTDDGDDEITIWIDGLNRGSSSNGSGAPATSDSNNLLLGGTTTANYHGYIDDFKIYNYERTQIQVNLDYNSRGTPKGAGNVLGASASNNTALSDGLVGYWKLDEASGNATDSSGNGNTLTDTNTVTRGPGKFGNDGDFANSDDLRIADNASLSMGDIDFSVSTWVNLDTKAATQPLVAKGASGSITEYLLIYFVTSDTFRVAIQDSGAVNTCAVSATSFGSPSTGTWYFVTFWHDSVKNTLNIQVNDGNTDSVACTTGSFDGTNSFFLGNIGNDATFLDGKLDDVRVYKKVLSNAERSYLYNWAPGPVGYWKLDENTGTSANDSSGNSKTATLTNTPTWAPGKFGSGVLFAGSNQHITRADDADLDFIDDSNMTYSTWFKHGTASAQEIILSKYNEAGYKMIMESDGDITCALDYDSTWSPTDSATSTAATYDDNVWHYLACVKTGASSLKLYIDGSLIATDSSITATNTLTNSDPIYFGIDADATSNDFTGNLDDIKIYTYNRNSKQIIEDMNAGHPTGGSPIGSQIVYYKLDEQQGTTINNTITANTFAETISGATWKPAGSSACKINGCLSFDGVDDIVSITDDNKLDFTTEGTISLWIKPATTTQDAFANFVSKTSNVAGGSAAGIAYWFIWRQTDNVLQGGISDGTNTTTVTAPLFTDTNWHHTVLTWDASSMKIYKDGILAGTSANTRAAQNTTDNLKIGGDAFGTSGGTTDYWEGQLDEIKMYNSALTADEIKIDYNAGSAIALGGVLGTQDNEGFGGAAPVGYWNLDENTGTTNAFDISGNDNTLTLTNTDATDWTPGKYGSAIDLDGSNEHLTRADDADFDFGAGASFTLQGWFKHTTQASGQDIFISKYNEAGYKLYMESDGDLTCGIDYDSTFSPTDSITSTAATYDDNNWHFVTCVKNANTSLSLYIDGILIGSDTSLTNSTLVNSDPIYVGIDADGSSNAWLGKIDDVKIYNYARTQAQISYDLDRGAPQAFYKFDECQGTTANNSAITASGFAGGNVGTIVIGATGDNTVAGTCTGAAGEAWADGAIGKRNAGLDLDGTDDYVTLASDANMNLKQMSFAGWVKIPIDAAYNIFVRADTAAATTNRFGLVVGNFTSTLTNELFGLSKDSGGIRAGYISTNRNELFDGNWHHLAFTSDGSVFKLYLDGQNKLFDVGQGSDDGNTVVTSYDVTTFGVSNQAGALGGFLAGQIDDFRLYHYALSAAQVKQIYNNGAVFFGPNVGTP